MKHGLLDDRKRTRPKKRDARPEVLVEKERLSVGYGRAEIEDNSKSQ